MEEPKPKKPTHTDAQQITDDEDNEEPFYSQKRAVQDRIFMARICEMGGRSEDQLQFMVDALVRKETHSIKDLTVPTGKYPADYTRRERDTIYIGFKNSVSPLRVSLRLINSLLENPKYGKYTGALNKYKQNLITELIEKCDLITQKLQQYAIGRKGNSTDTEAFF